MLYSQGHSTRSQWLTWRYIAIEADDVIRDELGLTPKPAEDPYKTPVHIEMLDKDGMVVSENDYLGIMLPSDNPNEINLSLKPIE